MRTLVTTGEKKNGFVIRSEVELRKSVNRSDLTGRKKVVFYLGLSLKALAGHPRIQRNF